MKNILIITAHPSNHNLTIGMKDIIKTEQEKKGNEVKVVDLYKDKQLPFKAFENSEDAYEVSHTEDPTIVYYQTLIQEADKLIFVYPFWWGSMPAILKNWIDNVLTMGFAAKYNEKGMPEGLLQGRSVEVFTTSGTPTFLYYFNGILGGNKRIWKKTIIAFCGMKFDGYNHFGWVDTKGKNVDKIFKKVRKLAQN